jgi:hypothetical protein
MTEKDLIEKLENIDIPEVELSGHKAALRMALLNSDYFKKSGFFNVFKRVLVYGVPAVATLAVMMVTVINPKITEARILSAAKNNPDIQKLIKENNLSVSDIKTKDGMAYVLLSPANNGENNFSNFSGEDNVNIKKIDKASLSDGQGTFVEFNFQKNQVMKVDSVDNEKIMPLTGEDKDSAQEIAGTNSVVKDIIPKDAQIGKIESSLGKTRLVDKNNTILVVPQKEQEKKARVHYRSDGKDWVVNVNLDKQKVEDIQYFSDNN